MEVFDNIKENAKQFVLQNTKLTVGITAILVGFFIFAIISSAFEKPVEKQVPVILPDKIPYAAVEDFFPPQKHNLTEDYYFARSESSVWSKKEFSRWFTVPTENSVESLRKTNNQLTEEILGVAP